MIDVLFKKPTKRRMVKHTTVSKTSNLHFSMTQYRCILTDCSALLFKGVLIHAKIEIQCKCGAMNTFDITPAISGKSEDREEKKKLSKGRPESPSA